MEGAGAHCYHHVGDATIKRAVADFCQRFGAATFKADCLDGVEARFLQNAELRRLFAATFPGREVHVGSSCRTARGRFQKNRLIAILVDGRQRLARSQHFIMVDGALFACLQVLEIVFTHENPMSFHVDRHLHIQEFAVF